jgi:hypothetical protein
MRLPKTAWVSLAAGAVAAAVAVAASLPTAGASTTACGSACFSPSVESLGTSEVLAVSGSSAGSGVTMATSSTTNSAEDWTYDLAAQDVAQAALDDVVSPKLALDYSTDPLVELQYVPDGDTSDLCLADTASEADDGVDGEDVSDIYVPTLSLALEQCGLTAQSLWVVDENTEAIESNGYVDLINAGYQAAYSYGNQTSATGEISLTSPFAEPAVLTVNSKGNVVLAPLSEVGGVVSPSQLWGNLPSQVLSASALRAAGKTR